MELALLLVFCVILNLCLTFFLLGRVRDYLRRVKRMEKNVTRLAEVVKDEHESSNADVFDSTGSLSDLLANASAEDVEQAQQVLDMLRNVGTEL